MDQESAWKTLDLAFQNETGESLKRLIQDEFSQIPPAAILKFLFESRTGEAALLEALQKLTEAFSGVLLPEIFLAAQNRRWGVVQSLIKKFRPDVMRMRDENGYPLLYFSVLAGDLEATKWLVTYGAKLNPADPCCFLILKAAIPHGNPELVKFLIQECHISANTPHEQAEIVMEAAAQGNRDLLEFLMELWQIPPVILQNPELLHSAARRGSLEMVRFLLQQGADVHHAIHRETVLHAAVEGRSSDVVRLLTEFAAAHPAQKHSFFSWGASSLRLDARNAQGKTALELALEANLPEIAEFLAHAKR